MVLVSDPFSSHRLGCGKTVFLNVAGRFFRKIAMWAGGISGCLEELLWLWMLGFWDKSYLAGVVNGIEEESFNYRAGRFYLADR